MKPDGDTVRFRFQKNPKINEISMIFYSGRVTIKFIITDLYT